MSEPLCLASACGQLRVRFFADDDRFGHVIECQVADAFAPLLRSVEGTADQTWPASSPLQEVRRAGASDAHGCLLGTGMAGRSFWSLSVVSAPGALEFDHACRFGASSATTPNARTTYEPQREWKLRGEQAIVWSDPNVALLVVPLATPSSDPPAIEMVDRRLLVQPTIRQELSPTNRTVRWAFQFKLDRA